MTTFPPSRSRSRPGLWLALGLLGGAGGALGLRAWLAPATTGAAHACADGFVLEAELEMVGYGAWYGFTVDRPGLLRFTIDLPVGVESTLLWGRLGTPAPGEPSHLPEPQATERIALSGPMSRPLERRPTALGPHVLFVEQVSLAMGEMTLPVHVRIELVADAARCPDAPR